MFLYFNKTSMGLVRFKTNRGPPRGLRTSHVSSSPFHKKISSKSSVSEFSRFKDKLPSLGGVVELRLKKGKRLKLKIAPGGLWEMIKEMFETPMEVIAKKMGKVFKWSISLLQGWRLSKARNNGRNNLEKSKQIGRNLQFT